MGGKDFQIYSDVLQRYQVHHRPRLDGGGEAAVPGAGGGRKCKEGGIDTEEGEVGKVRDVGYFFLAPVGAV